MFETLSRSLSDPETANLAAAVLLTFAAVFTLVLGASNYVRTRNALKRRTAHRFGLARSTAAAAQEGLENETSLGHQNILSTSELISEAVRTNAANEGEASEIKREMLHAGFFGPRSVFWYQLTRAALTVAAGLAGYSLFGEFFPQMADDYQIWFGLGLGCVGFLLPNRYVVMRQNRVVQQCREGFPDFIDLMIVCAEAGFGPRAAFDRISREIAKAYPILGAHCYLASLEIRAGSSLHDALFGLSHRIHVKEAAMLASLLEQTEQLGTSVTDALRVYSDEMRMRRLASAEEKAHALPAKLVLPLALFIFPVILIVILLPAVVRVNGSIF